MPAQGKKSLPIEEDVHKSIEWEKVRTSKEMYLLVREAWALYCQHHKISGVPLIATPEGGVQTSGTAKTSGYTKLLKKAEGMRHEDTDRPEGRRKGG